MGAACVRPGQRTDAVEVTDNALRAVVFCVLRTTISRHYRARYDALHAALHVGTRGPKPCIYEGGGLSHLVCVGAEVDLVRVAAQHGFECGSLLRTDVPAAAFTPQHRAWPNYEEGGPAYVLTPED